jgi:hypothetical protein
MHTVSLPDDLTEDPDPYDDNVRLRADRTVVALEAFLAAVHVSRADRRA